jgi:hypothetical protein
MGLVYSSYRVIAIIRLQKNDYRTVETQGVDTSETYYEVPHWMHLSFINYDRDDRNVPGHGNPQEEAALKVKNDWFNFYEVGSNGFLRPKVDPNAAAESGRSNPGSSFSAIGNAAATPGKSKSTQERQLISGRDFRDILEACRPRMSGVRMPSALTALLKLRQVVTSGKMPQTKKGTTYASTDKPVPLREWGAVDFSEMVVSPIPRRDSASFRRSPSTIGLDRGDGSESGSNSSIASHVSSLFGISYDRVLWEQHDSPVNKKSTIQIQRSPSLEFDNLSTSLRLDSDAARSDDSLSLDTDNVSRSSRGKSPVGELDWADDDASQAPKFSKRVESMRKMMDALDALSCAAVGPPDNKALQEVGMQKADSSLNLIGEMELSTTPRAGGNSQNL